VRQSYRSTKHHLLRIGDHTGFSLVFGPKMMPVVRCRVKSHLRVSPFGALAPGRPRRVTAR
jgi:hypothetical protein